MRPRLPFRAPSLLLLALAACSHRDDDASQASTPVNVSMRPATAAPDSLRAGDVRIVTVDGGLDLALIGDSISTGLAPAALEKARRETDTAAVAGSGFGASIEKMVKGKVASAIGVRAAFPLTAVRDVRYEGGALHFDWTDRPVRLFENAKVNGRPVLESFSPAEAQRFVDAVRARKSGKSKF